MHTQDSFRPGTKIANGATVIDSGNNPLGRGIVLAVIPEELSADPYATWEIGPDGFTHTGHYSANLVQALADFHDRLGISEPDDDEELLAQVYGVERPAACNHGHLDCAEVEGGPCANETYARLLAAKRS